MHRDHDLEYKRTEAQLRAFLRRSGEISSDSEPVSDEPGALIDEDQIARSRQAEIDHLLSELDDDPVEAPSADEPSNDEPVAIEAAPAPIATSDKRAALIERNEMIRNAQTEKKRRYNRNRVRLHRAKSGTRYATLVAKLLKATANPRGNKLLEQLRGKERSLAMFCHVARSVTAKCGPLSAADLAAECERLTGDKISRLQAHRYRERIAVLQVEGGPWHNL